MVASRLVDKFGLDVFSKLWPVFAGNRDAYVAAFKAFSAWHLRRMSHARAQVYIYVYIRTHTHTYTYTHTHTHTKHTAHTQNT